MVVVSRDHQNRNSQPRHPTRHLGDLAVRRVGGVEQVPRHEHEAGVGVPDGVPDPADGGKSLHAEAGTVVGVFHAVIGLADVPVRSVDEGEGRHQSGLRCLAGRPAVRT
jgi:hypothetical protein